MSKTIFLGCGTGRCGTTSLAKLLASCEDTVCTHERRPVLPWVFDEELFQERVTYFSQLQSSASLVGDVSYFYLPYLEHFIRIFPQMKIVCLERDRQEVIDSFMWQTQYWNHWYNHDGKEWLEDNIWDVTYPKYDIPDKPKAIGAYWDDYRKQIRLIAKTYPKNVQIFRMDILSTLEGQKKIFDFLSVPEKNRRYQEKRRHNARTLTNRFSTKDEAIDWMRRLPLAIQDIAALIPSGDTFILVDQESIREDLPTNRHHVIPFLERDGMYWGLPFDDTIAIHELERLRQSGVSFIVFGWPAFWWFDYYSQFHHYLLTKLSCVLRNDRLVVFDLRTRT